MATEFELIRRIGAGDQEALETLYDQYYRRLSRFLYRMTGDTELVVELVNDVFLVVWQKAPEFRGESSVSTWVLGIGYYKALKALKARRLTVSLDDVDVHAPIEQEMMSGHLDLVAGINKLSALHKAVMELTFYFGYSYKEIAEICGSPENTIKTRMFHARRLLKSMLEV